MKYIVFIAIAILHLAYLIGNSINNSITSYFEFYRVTDKSHGWSRVMDTYNEGFGKMNAWKPVMAYAKYTGSEMGYGFFAPNVLSSGALVFEYKNKSIAPRINSYEGWVRFSSVISRFIGHQIRPLTARDTTSVDPNIEVDGKKIGFKKTYEIENQYYEVVLKNIATKVYADYGCNDTLKVKLYLYLYPPLKDFDKRKDKKEKFLCIKENNIFTKMP